MRFADGETNTAQIRLSMQKEMQKNAAVFRTAESLQEGVKNMKEIYKSLTDIKVNINYIYLYNIIKKHFE